MGIIEELASLRASVEALGRAVGRHSRVPEQRWGVVTTLTPDIRVTFPGESGEVIITRSTETVWVGARVLVQVQGTDRWIVGGTGPAWRPHTPTLNGLTLGNGSMAAKYAQIGTVVNLHVEINFGTTTTVDNFSFSLPVPTIGTTAASVVLLDGGVAWYSGIGMIGAGGPTIASVYGTSGTNGRYVALAGLPWVWGAGDAIVLDATYQTN